MSKARAKDAASLVVYRRRANSIEVLMGKRQGRTRFAPGVYVFPGGMLEVADSKLTSLIPFRSQGVATTAISRIQELAIAAIRETWEETGLLLAEKGEIDSASHPAWERCHELGMVPAPHHLSYLGRAITPTEWPLRYHARFFVAPLERFYGSLTDNGELSDLRWIPLKKPVSLPMLDVTEFMLEELQRFFDGPRSGTPLMSYRRDRTLIRYE